MRAVRVLELKPASISSSWRRINSRQCSCIATTSALFLTANSFPFFVAVLFFAGIGVGVFKTAALALIGDKSGQASSQSIRRHGHGVPGEVSRYCAK